MCYINLHFTYLLTYLLSLAVFAAAVDHKFDALMLILC